MDQEELQPLKYELKIIDSSINFNIYHITDAKFLRPLVINIYNDGIIVKDLNDQNKRYIFGYLDIFGVEVPLEDDDDHLCFNIISTKFKDVGWFFSNIDETQRVPDIIEFKIRNKDHSYNELVEFKHYVMNHFWKWMQKKYDSGFDFQKEAGSYVHPVGFQPYEAKVMVFVSPASGKGYAPARWKIAERFLRARGFHPIVHHTTRRRYIIDTIREMSQDEYKQIYLFIGVGGDGLIHEIQNGFKTRPDVEQNTNNLKMRCASMMGGSACSTVSFMAIRWNQNRFSLYNNLYIMSRVRLFDAKTMVIETNGEQKIIHSFHTFSSGLIADVVKNSQVLRFLGEMRYFILLIVGLFIDKKIDSNFYITEDDVILPPLDQPLDIENLNSGQKKGWVTYTGSLYLVMAMIFEFLTNDFKLSDRCKLDGELGECFYLKGSLGRSGLQTFQRGFIGFDLETRGFDSYEMWKSIRVINKDPKVSSEDACFQVDGEVYFCSSFQCTQKMEKNFSIVQ